jgi:hypothetical protein
MNKCLVLECKNCGNCGVKNLDDSAFVPDGFICSCCGCAVVMDIHKSGTVNVIESVQREHEKDLSLPKVLQGEEGVWYWIGGVASKEWKFGKTVIFNDGSFVGVEILNPKVSK